jgi:hypothetical protein
VGEGFIPHDAPPPARPPAPAGPPGHGMGCGDRWSRRRWRECGEKAHPDTLVVFLYLIVYNICLHRPNTMAVHLLRDPSVDDGRPVWIQLSTLTLRVQHRIGHPRREEEMVQCSITCTTPKTVTIRFRELGCRRKFSWRARRSVWIMVGVPTPSNGYYISIAALGIIPPHHLCIQSVAC